MFLAGGSKHPPWSKSRKHETRKMAIKTSVEVKPPAGRVQKAVAAVKKFFKK